MLVYASFMRSVAASLALSRTPPPRRCHPRRRRVHRQVEFIFARVARGEQRVRLPGDERSRRNCPLRFPAPPLGGAALLRRARGTRVQMAVVRGRRHRRAPHLRCSLLAQKSPPSPFPFGASSHCDAVRVEVFSV